MGTGTGSIDLSTLNNLHTNLTQHFWFNSDAGATYGTGVHITLSSQAEFIANPTGQNILMNTDGISIRNGTVPLMVLDNDSLDFNVVVDLEQGTYSNVATFGATGFRMGAITDGETRLVANGGGIDLIRRDGTSDSVLAHFGYDVGIAESGTAVAPYYTFGTRESGSTVGNYSMAIGENITASGWRSYAEGFLTVASGGTSHAEGNRSVASGSVSHAEGYKTTASSSYTHAEGYESAASGKYSHAEGAGTTSSGAQSHAEGSGTTSSGAYSHAEGYESTAFGNYSHAQNRYTVANGEAQTVIGKYNQPNTTSAFIIGNGTSATALSNAFAVDWDGNVKAKGDIYVNCDADSSGGKKIGENKVLWSGAWFMNGDQKATLSEKVSEQLTGIVLVWSYYTNGAAQEYGWNTFFVPKIMVQLKLGVGYDIPLRRTKNAAFGTKYVYVNDNSIVGHADNVATGTANNVPYKNNQWVLRYVFGC